MTKIYTQIYPSVKTWYITLRNDSDGIPYIAAVDSVTGGIICSLIVFTKDSVESVKNSYDILISCGYTNQGYSFTGSGNIVISYTQRL